MKRYATMMAVLLAVAGCDDESTDPAASGSPDAEVRAEGACSAGETMCDEEGRQRTCLDDESGWLVEVCPEGTVCAEGACAERVCEPNARRCDADGAVQQCDPDGEAWSDPARCAEEQSCVDGVCLDRSCTPGERACGDGALLTCADDGLSWSREDCPEDERCVDGACAAPEPVETCPPGEVLCGPEGVVTCADGEWTVEACAEGEACFEGRCVGCVRDADCEGGVCADDACQPAPLAILTADLPAGQVDVDYAVTLEAENGEAPYTWSLIEGNLPPGMLLFDNGNLEGTPRRAGEFPLRVGVEDDAGATAEADLTLQVAGDGLVITTESPLPGSDEGEPYEVQFEAVGGTPPYGWFITEGAAPGGLALGADGGLRGTPNEVGPFDFTLRVVDSAAPPAFTDKAFSMEVTVAPLRIVSEQSFDLFVTQVVVLPTITVIENIPVPYRAELQARGGLRPYTWVEEEIDENLRRFIPQSGIPEGLELGEDGVLEGAVVDTSQVIELQIPFTQITLTGFFFFAEVRDSQDVADRDSAIFLLPTIPIGG